MTTARDIMTPGAQYLEDSSSVPDAASKLAEAIGADDSIEEAAETMKKSLVRRLPVIDGNQVVGMVSQADLARALSHEQAGDLLAALSA